MLSERQLHCLNAMGIRLWRKPAPAAGTATAEDPAITRQKTPDHQPGRQPSKPVRTLPLAPQPIAGQQPALPESPAITVKEFDLSDWVQTLQAIDACQNCELAHSCTRKVPGKGNQQADLMIIGEAPGHEEDRQGKPFVGRAGQLLDRMLEAIDIDPDSVYITNILKCRPPNNRDPKPEEVVACAQFLQAQIRLVQPRVIFSVGRVSAQNLLHVQTPVGRLRGQAFTLPHTDIPLRVTYHPAYLLRNPADKAKVWQDLKALRALLEQSPSRTDAQ